ncbi:MAG: hypothetical protein ACI89J_002830, partial [Hyphomicrobiaceae bacterium]
WISPPFSEPDTAHSGKPQPVLGLKAGSETSWSKPPICLRCCYSVVL